MSRKSIAGFLILGIIIILTMIAYLSSFKVDTDKDGITDELDSFPNDARFHKKCCIDTSTNVLLESGEKYYPKGCECFDINCECKCIGIDWCACGKDKDIDFEEKELMYITVISPDTSFRYTKNEFQKNYEQSNIRINIDSASYLGEWEIYFLNDIGNPSIFIDYDIYRMI